MLLLRYFHTLRYVKVSQIYWRIYYKFIKPNPNLSHPPFLRRSNKKWIIPAKRSARMHNMMQFEFLNENHIIEYPTDWNHAQYSKLWNYNLHYFDDLNSQGAELRRNWHRDLISKWIDDNPIGHGNGWEPYPLSLRIVNWIKWALAENMMEDEWLHSLAIQVRYLMQSIEWHLLGNHLFSNAKALVFAGIYFDGKEAEEWYKTGLQIIERELPEQVLEDGGNFELSTMYHSIFLEDLLDLLNLFNNYPIEIPRGLLEITPRMLTWLKTMIHPDQEISLFNDAAFDIAASPLELIDYSKRLNINSDLKENRVTYLEDSGYIRFQDKKAVLILDVAKIGPDYLPGHAHADTLTFELSLFDERVIVNTGTSVYGTGKERLKERGTAAHNTVMIDDFDSSEIWSGFRVAKRAYPFDVDIKQNKEHIIVTGSHNGYKRLNGKPIHRRNWYIDENELRITDNILSKKTHNIVSFIHLHPDINITRKNEFEYVLVTKSAKTIKVTFSGCDSVEVTPYDYHPEFGKTIPSMFFACHLKKKFSIEISMNFKW